MNGEVVEFAVDFGPLPRTISSSDGIETISCDSETVYHGSSEALIAAGICARQRLPLGVKHTGRGDHTNSTEPMWFARRQLDNTFVYYLETETAFRERLRKRDESAKQCQSLGSPPAPTTAADWKAVHMLSFRGAVLYCQHLLNKPDERFRFSAKDGSKLESLIQRFRSEVLDAIEMARVEDAQRACLQLVVNNGG